MSDETQPQTQEAAPPPQEQGILSALAAAQENTKRIKYARNMFQWLGVRISFLEKIVKDKQKLLRSLTEDLPGLELKLSQHNKQYDKLNTYLAKNEGAEESTDEAEALAKKIEKMVKEVAKMRAELEEKTATNKDFVQPPSLVLKKFSLPTAILTE